MEYRNAQLSDLPEIVAIYNSTVAGRMVTADTEEVTVSDKRKWFEAHHERPVALRRLISVRALVLEARLAEVVTGLPQRDDELPSGQRHALEQATR